jgi:hypothetical protein
MSPKGVRIEKGEPVERMSSEGPLDQNLGVNVDDHQSSVVFLDSVTDENDIFKRSPVLGEIDGDKDIQGKSVNKALAEEDYLKRSVYINPAGTDLAELGGGQTVDKFAVSDASWMDNPDELIWKSAMLAQLKAKENAIEHFLNDPAVANFAGKMSEEDRKLVAQRARQLAAELQDEALNEMNENLSSSIEAQKQSIMKTKERFLRYVVTDEDAIKAGGLTESEVNELFEEGR